MRHRVISAVIALAALTAGPATSAPENPLMQPSTLPFGALPFDRISDSDYQPAIEAGMAQQLKEIRAIANPSMTQHHSDQVVNDIAARYFLVLGTAAADLWGELPQELQHRLFERAVLLGHQGEQDESLREQLAKFMHDHHERTLHERATHERTLAR